MWYVLEHGQDCDGGCTRGRVEKFETQTEAEEYQQKKHEWSDGFGYELTNDINIVNKYYIDYEMTDYDNKEKGFIWDEETFNYLND